MALSKGDSLHLFPFFVSEVLLGRLNDGKIGELGECLEALKLVTSQKVKATKISQIRL